MILDRGWGALCLCWPSKAPRRQYLPAPRHIVQAKHTRHTTGVQPGHVTQDTPQEQDCFSSMSTATYATTSHHDKTPHLWWGRSLGRLHMLPVMQLAVVHAAAPAEQRGEGCEGRLERARQAFSFCHLSMAPQQYMV